MGILGGKKLEYLFISNSENPVKEAWHVVKELKILNLKKQKMGKILFKNYILSQMISLQKSPTISPQIFKM